MQETTSCLRVDSGETVSTLVVFGVEAGVRGVAELFYFYCTFGGVINLDRAVSRLLEFFDLFKDNLLFLGGSSLRLGNLSLLFHLKEGSFQ